LCICDDGADDGEWIRIRDDHLVIGRTDGDVRIAHDPMIAPRHAEITRTSVDGKWHWHLTDLHSLTGTFVSVTERQLKNGAEMWLGSRRYRFELAHADQLPSLRDLETPANCYLFDGPNVVLGRQPTMAAGSIRVDDPQLSAQHVRLERRGQNWHVVHLGGKNGLWVRVDRVRFPVMCRFQLGEQRFVVRVVA
jgi:pSer/pThr/pTyr-binding forkhead associated (FHA) protein